MATPSRWRPLTFSTPVSRIATTFVEAVVVPQRVWHERPRSLGFAVNWVPPTAAPPPARLPALGTSVCCEPPALLDVAAAALPAIDAAASSAVVTISITIRLYAPAAGMRLTQMSLFSGLRG